MPRSWVPGIVAAGSPLAMVASRPRSSLVEVPNRAVAPVPGASSPGGGGGRWTRWRSGRGRPGRRSVEARPPACLAVATPALRAPAPRTPRPAPRTPRPAATDPALRLSRVAADPARREACGWRSSRRGRGVQRRPSRGARGGGRPRRARPARPPAGSTRCGCRAQSSTRPRRRRPRRPGAGLPGRRRRPGRQLAEAATLAEAAARCPSAARSRAGRDHRVLDVCSNPVAPGAQAPVGHP